MEKFFFLIIVYNSKEGENMKLIVGLGNPGKKYEKTRHNTGFMVVDRVADQCQITISQNKFNALIAQTTIGSIPVLLMKPQTYMNLSGEAVIAASKFYKIQPEDILVISDDLDLPIGKIRLRETGSAGGQKGLKNIMDHLHTQQIPRLRVGIGKNPFIDTVDYVLGKIEKENLDTFNDSLDRAAAASIAFVLYGMKEAMNRYNTRG